MRRGPILAATMDSRDEQNRPSSRGEDDTENAPVEVITEGLASMRWHREEGRVTCREDGRRTPTPHRVNLMPSAQAGPPDRGDSEGDDDERDRPERSDRQTQLSTIAKRSSNTAREELRDLQEIMQ